MNSVGIATRSPIGFVLSLGLLGGGLLIITVSLSHRGPLVFLPYAALVLACAAFLRAERVRGYARRFTMSLGTFMASTVVLYVFIGAVQAKTLTKISLGGHAWRLGLMLLIGTALSAAVAQLTGTEPATMKELS